MTDKPRDGDAERLEAERLGRLRASADAQRRVRDADREQRKKGLPDDLISIRDAALREACTEIERLKEALIDRASIVAIARNCPEPIINEMMEVRVKEVAGLHMADQIRRMLLVFADAIERRDHAQPEPARREPHDAG